MTRPTEFSSDNDCSATEGAVVECYKRATEAEDSPLLRFFTRKLLVKTLQRNSHCGEKSASKDW
jgi:hypothetical protein